MGVAPPPATSPTGVGRPHGVGRPRRVGRVFEAHRAVLLGKQSRVTPCVRCGGPRRLGPPYGLRAHRGALLERRRSFPEVPCPVGLEDSAHPTTLRPPATSEPRHAGPAIPPRRRDVLPRRD